MIADEIAVIDADAHISEPPEMWTSRLGAKWRADAPQVRQMDTGPDGTAEDVWFVGRRPVVPAWQSANAGWKDFFPGHPPRQADAHAGA